MAGNISLKRNIWFQTLYQIVNTCIPLITAPYLSRVLGADKLGVYSFTSSVVAYFTLAAMLGTVNYGTRAIASVKDDDNKLSQTFWSIYSLQAIVTCIALVFYIGYLGLFCRDNIVISTLQTIAVIDCFFNINWLYFGLEKFQFTATRSLIIRVLTVIAILVFIKQPSDLWLYALIMLSGTILSNMIMWIYLRKIVKWHRSHFPEIVSHLKQNLVLFVPLLAMSIYHIMDKTMLGLLSTYEQSGFYYNADKVINIPVGILIGIPTVLLPRMTSLITKGKSGEGDRLYLTSLEGVVLISISFAFGVASISKEFAPLFFGPGFDDCILLIIVLSPVLIIKGFSLTARNQYLIPHHLEKIFIKSVVLGGIVNIVINAILIKPMGAMGAVIGTITAELLACIIQYFEMRKYIKVGIVLKRTVIYILFGIIMFIAVRLCSMLPLNIYLVLTIEILVGAIVFICLCCIYGKVTKNQLIVSVFEGLKNTLKLFRIDKK